MKGERLPFLSFFAAEAIGLKTRLLMNPILLKSGKANQASLIINSYAQDKPTAKIKVAVIQLPHMSNFTDFEPLINDDEVLLDFVDTPSFLDKYDFVIISGSKRTIQDLKCLKRRGFKKILKNHKGKILGFIEETLLFNKEKTIRKDDYNVFGLKVKSYEVHHGEAKEIDYHQKNTYGTFLHGIFENNNFRKFLFEDYQGYNFPQFKKDKIHAYSSFINENLNLETINKEIA